MINEFNEKFELLENVLGYFPVPMAWMNNNNEFVFMNDAFTDLLGYTIAEIPDIEHWFISAYPDEEYRWERIEKWSRINSEAKNNPNFEIPRQVINVTCKDGSVRIIEMYGASRDRDYLLILIDVTERINTEREKKHLLDEFKEILTGIKMLSGILPICSKCKKIRSSDGYWEQLEMYIRRHSEAEFTHGICPDCAKELYPEFDF
ncbi:PAS domain S-box protein [Candidatus Latescibacterota bacterium]